MSGIATVVVIIVIVIGIVAYLRQSKATSRTRRALGKDNIVIVPSSKYEGIYQIWDKDTKELLSVAKDIDDGLREYIIYVNNKAVRTIVDNANEVLKVYTVNVDGNVYDEFHKFQGKIEGYNWIRL